MPRRRPPPGRWRRRAAPGPAATAARRGRCAGRHPLGRAAARPKAWRTSFNSLLFKKMGEGFYKMEALERSTESREIEKICIGVKANERM